MCAFIQNDSQLHGTKVPRIRVYEREFRCYITSCEIRWMKTLQIFILFFKIKQVVIWIVWLRKINNMHLLFIWGKWYSNPGTVLQMWRRSNFSNKKSSCADFVIIRDIRTILVPEKLIYIPGSWLINFNNQKLSLV